MNDEQAGVLAWYTAMVAVTTTLQHHAPEVLAELLAWEAENCGGETATSDWPGWERYLGPKPQGPPLHVKAKVPHALRMAVYERDGFRCRDCEATDDLSIDHIIPESRGGPTELDNLQTLCRPCNTRKGTRMPSELR